MGPQEGPLDRTLRSPGCPQASATRHNTASASSVFLLSLFLRIMILRFDGHYSGRNPVFHRPLCHTFSRPGNVVRRIAPPPPPPRRHTVVGGEGPLPALPRPLPTHVNVTAFAHVFAAAKLRKLERACNPETARARAPRSNSSAAFALLCNRFFSACTVFRDEGITGPMLNLKCASRL